MAIKATMFQTSMEVKISSKNKKEFDRDLASLKAAINPADREWLAGKGVWLLKHPARYYHLRFVQVAMDERRRQPSLL